MSHYYDDTMRHDHLSQKEYEKVAAEADNELAIEAMHARIAKYKALVAPELEEAYERIAELEAKVKGYRASVNQDRLEEYVLAQINEDLRERNGKLEAALLSVGGLAAAEECVEKARARNYRDAIQDVARKALEEGNG